MSLFFFLCFIWDLHTQASAWLENQWAIVNLKKVKSLQNSTIQHRIA